MSKRILIADDDTSILESVKLMLEDEGYVVETTASGAELKNLGDDLPAMLILDIWMSGVDGQDICKYLKNQETTKHLPIILFSANRNIKEIAEKAGADTFLSKPFDINVLLEKVQYYIEHNYV